MDEDDEADGANYQLEMMRCLREVNVDNNTVGWCVGFLTEVCTARCFTVILDIALRCSYSHRAPRYQSTYLGSYQTVEFIETFLNYQVPAHSGCLTSALKAPCAFRRSETSFPPPTAQPIREGLSAPCGYALVVRPLCVCLGAFRALQASVSQIITHLTPRFRRRTLSAASASSTTRRAQHRGFSP